MLGYQLGGTSSGAELVALQEVETCKDANRDVEAKTPEPKVSRSSKHDSSGERELHDVRFVFNGDSWLI